MKQNPLVSVIVPNYNYARFLRQRIDSILLQDFTDYELILLDDASSDDSRSILESYRSNPHTACIVCNEQNSGSPFSQWQKGLSLARGKYVWIAESDDYAASSFLRETVDVMERHPEAVICFAGSSRIDPHGHLLKKDNDYWSRNPMLHRRGYRVLDGMAYIVHNLYWRNYIYNASGALFKKDALKDVDLSSCTAMHCCGDWLFWAKLAAHGQVIEIYKKLNYFRSHMTGNIHGRLNRSLEGTVKLIKLLFMDFAPAVTTGAAAIVTIFYKLPVPVALLVVLVIPVGTFIVFRQISTQKGIRVELMETKAEMDGTMVELLGGIETIRALDSAEAEGGRIQHRA